MPQTCCIAGGGPAGMMLGYLLARAGLEVLNSVDASGSESRQFRCAVHNADFVPKESRSACLCMRYQRFCC